MSLSFSIDSSGFQFVTLSYTTYYTTFNGTSANKVAYDILYASPTTFKVEITGTQMGTTLDGTAWILGNGTVAAFNYLGRNLTGSEATGIFQGLMAPFAYEADYGAIVGAFTLEGGVQVMNNGNASIGAASFSVRNYAASSLPLPINVCGGAFVISSYALQTGTVQGAQSPLLTLLNVAGTVTFNHELFQINSLYLQITSVQKA